LLDVDDRPVGTMELTLDGSSINRKVSGRFFSEGIYRSRTGFVWITSPALGLFWDTVKAMQYKME
jgi:hypothetical protein